MPDSRVLASNVAALDCILRNVHQLIADDTLQRALPFLSETFAVCCASFKKHGSIRTVHEAYGVLAEEFDEFFDEVRKQQYDLDAMRGELADIAAMCLKTVICLKL